ncbi:putative uncharacterized protein [Clostridium sp. CAG:448]|nr:putative uncharacterized protein [Clostridium sp. CAG:448]
MHERSALRAGENGFIDCLCQFLTAQDHAAARTAQRFVRRCGDNVGIRHRGGVQTGGDKTGDVCHIHHQIGADPIGNLTETGKINHARIGGSACKDQLGAGFQCQPFHLVVVDGLRFFGNAVGDNVEIFAGDVDGGAV